MRISTTTTVARRLNVRFIACIETIQTSWVMSLVEVVTFLSIRFLYCDDEGVRHACFDGT